MPNYAVSVNSDDNMHIAKAAESEEKTVEQYLKGEIHKLAEKLSKVGK